MNKRTNIDGQLNGLTFFAKKFSGTISGFTMVAGFTMMYLMMF